VALHLLSTQHRALGQIPGLAGPVQSGVGTTCIGPSLRGFDNDIALASKRRRASFADTFVRYRSSLCLHGLQALKLGWYMHGMVGFDHERARTALNLPVNVAIDAAFAIGGLGDKGLLPEALRSREIPSDRLPIERLVFEGAM
jgi:hypothetical protein